MEKINHPVFQSNDTQLLKKKTADSFGFEWIKFHQLKSEKGFLEFISPINKDFFKGKFVLDAGCGNGSYSYYAASYGAEVIAIDFSDSVSVAREKHKKYECPGSAGGYYASSIQGRII